MREYLHYRLIKGIIFSEKASVVGQFSQYVFCIDKAANKANIKNAIEYIYNVKVDRVNVLNIKGKNVTFKKVKGKRSDFKKAYVKLKDGYSINVGTS